MKKHHIRTQGFWELKKNLLKDRSCQTFLRTFKEEIPKLHTQVFLQKYQYLKTITIRDHTYSKILLHHKILYFNGTKKNGSSYLIMISLLLTFNVIKSYLKYILLFTNHSHDCLHFRQTWKGIMGSHSYIIKWLL